MSLALATGITELRLPAHLGKANAGSPALTATGPPSEEAGYSLILFLLVVTDAQILET